MPKSDLGGVEAAYLKEAYRLQELNRAPSVSVLAREFGVSMPSVVGVLRRLEARGFVKRIPWKTPRLTASGLTRAERIIHDHRILEVYFGDVLGLDADDACAEASKIDYLVGSRTIGKMCGALHRPARCLHGFKIEHPRSDRSHRAPVPG